MKNKTNNKSIIKTLGILAVSAFALTALMPAKAMADYNCGGVTYGNVASTSYTANCNNSNGNNTSNNYNNNGYNGNNTSSNQTNPVPIVYSVTPNGVDLNAIVGNMAVNVNGANFVQNSLAEFNNSPRNTIFNSSTQLTVILTVADLATAGDNVITVFNPAPNGGGSNGVLFKVKTVVVSQPKKPTAVASVKPKKATVAIAPKKAAATEDLSANSLLAANGFMPTNLLQWVLALFLVLLIVLIARKAYGNENNNKVKTEKMPLPPLKHA